MNNSDDDLRQEVALFRYGVIVDLVHLPVGTQGIGEKLRDKASHNYTIPGSDRTHVAANTIRGWTATAGSMRSTPSREPTGGSPGGFRPRSPRTSSS